VQTFIKNEAGTAAASIDGNTLGIVAKDPVEGSTVQAYATFSRSELEQIRDAITEQLNRTADGVEVRETPEGTWFTYPGRANSEFVPNN
jgi:hypothetical protein